MLYDDGGDVRLLNTLSFQGPHASGDLSKWDSVMNVDRDVTVIANQSSHFPDPPSHLQRLYSFTSTLI